MRKREGGLGDCCGLGRYLIYVGLHYIIMVSESHFPFSMYDTLV